MSTENEEQEKPPITPQEMLQKTHRLFESLVTTKSKFRKKIETEPAKKETWVSSESLSPEISTSGKRRKIASKKLETDSSDDFEESPLRKSLSPKSPKNKDKSKSKNKGRSSTCTRDGITSPARRYKTRNGKARKKISYADVPEMPDSDTDFDSPKGNTTDSSSSSKSRSPRKRNTSDSSSSSKSRSPRKRRKLRSKKQRERSQSTVQKIEDHSESSEDIMIVERSSSTPKKQLPCFLQDENPRSSSNRFTMYSGRYYRDDPETSYTYDNGGEWISEESADSSDEAEPVDRLRSRRSRRRQPFDESSSSEDESQSASAGNDPEPEPGPSNADITPRRSNRNREGRHSSRIERGIRRFNEVRSGRRAKICSTEEDEGDDSGSSSEEDQFMKFCTQHTGDSRKETGRTFHGSQEAGPSTVQPQPQAEPSHVDVESSEENGSKGSVEQDNISRILREGKFKELPAETSPENNPGLLCEAARVSTPDLVHYLLLKFDFNPSEADSTRDRPISCAIKANRADNLLVLLTAIGNKPKKVCKEICRRCARDLITEDMSCLKALDDWHVDYVDPDSTFVVRILENARSSRQIFETIGKNFNLTALQHLISLDIELKYYPTSAQLVLKCLVSPGRWCEDEEHCREYLVVALECLKGADMLEEKDGDTFTPLMTAVQYDLPAAVDVLLDAGENPLAVSGEDRKTALHFAAAFGHVHCVERILLRNSGALSIADKYGWTAVMCAVHGDNWVTVDIMLSLNLSRTTHSTVLLTAIHQLKNRPYRRKEKKQQQDNYCMIMKLIKHVAHSDSYRHLLNDVIASCSNDISENIFKELMKFPGLVATGVKLTYIRSKCCRLLGCWRLSDLDRDNLLEDVLSEFKRTNDCIIRLSASFKNEPAGGPGPTKEFYQLFGQKVRESHLFKSTSEGSLMFTYLLLLYKNDRRKFIKFQTTYEMIGEMMARAVLNGLTLGLNLSEYIINYIQGGSKNVLKDLEMADKDVFNCIDGLSSEDFKDLEVSFYEKVEDPFTGTMIEVPMKNNPIPDEDDFATDKRGYLTLRSRKTLYEFPHEELEALKEGFTNIFPERFMELLSARELVTAISGSSNLNIVDWQNNTSYQRITQEVKTQFWRCVQSFNTEDRQSLLHFATGLSFLPPGGFVNLPGNKFTLVAGYGGMDESLPTAATCFNQLSLPPYSSEETMKKNILIAIRYGAKGFVFG